MTIPSRIERTHGRFVAVFGVDHVTGPFCQVWLAPIDQQAEPLIVTDNQGVRVAASDLTEALRLGGWAELLGAEAGKSVMSWIRQTENRYKQSAEFGNPYPNIDHQTVTRLFRLFGFPESIGREVWEAFD